VMTASSGERHHLLIAYIRDRVSISDSRFQILLGATPIDPS